MKQFVNHFKKYLSFSSYVYSFFSNKLINSIHYDNFKIYNNNWYISLTEDLENTVNISTQPGSSKVETTCGFRLFYKNDQIEFKIFEYKTGENVYNVCTIYLIKFLSKGINYITCERHFFKIYYKIVNEHSLKHAP